MNASDSRDRIAVEGLWMKDVGGEPSELNLALGARGTQQSLRPSLGNFRRQAHQRWPFLQWLLIRNLDSRDELLRG
jgi:hypothetical protein